MKVKKNWNTLACNKSCFWLACGGTKNMPHVHFVSWTKLWWGGQILPMVRTEFLLDSIPELCLKPELGQHQLAAWDPWVVHKISWHQITCLVLVLKVGGDFRFGMHIQGSIHWSEQQMILVVADEPTTILSRQPFHRLLWRRNDQFIVFLGLYSPGVSKGIEENHQ